MDCPVCFRTLQDHDRTAALICGLRTTNRRHEQMLDEQIAEAEGKERERHIIHNFN